MAALASRLYESDYSCQPSEGSAEAGLVDANGYTGAVPRASPIAPQHSIWYVYEVKAEDRRLMLSEPLRVEFTRGEDVAYVAYARSVDVGGVGATQEQAVADLGETAWMLWQSLNAGDAPLDESAARAHTRLSRVMPR